MSDRTNWHTHDRLFWELPVNFSGTSYNTCSSVAEMLKELGKQCCISENDLNAALERASREIGFSVFENQTAVSFSPNGLEELL